MVKINAVFTDYNETFDPKYLEVALSYALLNHHKEQGNRLRKAELKWKRQPQMWKILFRGGPDAVFEPFVEKVLTGETRESFRNAMYTVSQDDSHIFLIG